MVSNSTVVLGAPAGPFIRHENLPSASQEVSLTLVHVPGPAYDIAATPHLRVCFNLGPSYTVEVSGRGEWGSLACKHHALLIIPPGVEAVHCASTPKPAGRSHKPACLASFQISLKLYADAAVSVGLAHEIAALRHQVVETDEVLRLLAQCLFADLRDHSPDGAGATERLATALVGRLLFRERVATVGAARSGVELARTYIEQHLHMSLTLDVLALVAGMSQFHFCRVFRRNVGVTPHQYILAQRMEQARRLLWSNGEGRGSALSMLDVAQACGFSSPSHFAAQFKRHFGQTPRQVQRGQ